MEMVQEPAAAGLACRLRGRRAWDGRILTSEACEARREDARAHSCLSRGCTVQCAMQYGGSMRRAASSIETCSCDRMRRACGICYPRARAQCAHAVYAERRFHSACNAQSSRDARTRDADRFQFWIVFSGMGDYHQ